MPPKAVKDLMEWMPSSTTPLAVLSKNLQYKQNITDHLRDDKQFVVNDDHPFNEYFVVRRGFSSLFNDIVRF